MRKESEKFFWIILILHSVMTLINCERMVCVINKTWDNKSLNHVPAEVILYPDGDYVILKADAPFYGDPPPPKGEIGKPFNKLWDYEVVEAFFLGKDENYLEVELSPHGQHLVLLLSGKKNVIKMCLPLDYSVSFEYDVLDGVNKWHGVAKVPKAYFPPEVSFYNCYAIHGVNENRSYEALNPVPTGHFEFPDFHRLEYFKPIDFERIYRNNKHLSNVWKEALSTKGEALECSEK